MVINHYCAYSAVYNAIGNSDTALVSGACEQKCCTHFEVFTINYDDTKCDMQNI